MFRSAKYPNRIYQPGIETRFVVESTVSSSQRVSIRANAVLLQNSGNVSVILDGGFTLIAGQSLWFGNYSELSTVKVDTQVWFDDSTVPGGSTPVHKLEIVKAISHVSGAGFYIDES